MQSKSNQLLSLASKKQIIRSRDAHTLGIPRNYLPRLVRKGLLTKISRGLYRSKTSPMTEHLSLIEASYKVTKGVICLLSALRFHRFTTQSPHESLDGHRNKGMGPTNNFSSHSILCVCLEKHFILEFRNIQFEAEVSRYILRPRQLPIVSSFGTRLGWM